MSEKEEKREQYSACPKNDTRSIDQIYKGCGGGRLERNIKISLHPGTKSHPTSPHYNPVAVRLSSEKMMCNDGCANMVDDSITLLRRVICSNTSMTIYQHRLIAWTDVSSLFIMTASCIWRPPLKATGCNTILRSVSVNELMKLGKCNFEIFSERHRFWHSGCLQDNLNLSWC